MKFRITNTVGATILGLKGPSSRELDEEGFLEIVSAVKMHMTRFEQYYVTGADPVGQAITVPKTRRAPAYIKLFVADSDEASRMQEWSAEDLELHYGEYMRARKAEKVANAAARAAARKQRSLGK